MDKTLSLGKVYAISHLQERMERYSMALRKLERPVGANGLGPASVWEEYLRGLADGERCDRQVFLMVAMLLFCPAVLAGKRMRGGLRAEIARLFGLKAHSTVSDNCKDLLFRYNRFPDFRRKVDTLYERMCLKAGEDDENS